MGAKPRTRPAAASRPAVATTFLAAVALALTLAAAPAVAAPLTKLPGGMAVSRAVLPPYHWVGFAAA